MQGSPGGGTDAFVVRFDVANRFLRGDCNSDGIVDTVDVAFLQAFLFGGPAPVCHDAADFNDDGNVDSADWAGLSSHIGGAGPDPEPPFQDCGGDPRSDALPYCLYDACP